MDKSILQLFPQEYREIWERISMEQEKLQEIRLRVDKPILLHMSGEEYFVTQKGQLTKDVGMGRCISEREMLRTFEHICHYSPYAFEEELRRGFITVAGGHRVGVAGQAVMESDGKIRNLKNISYLNVRVAHQLRGVADNVLGKVYGGGKLKNTLIISPPGCGKTTLLRDLIRQISDGNRYGEGVTVGVVDERSEIAGSFCGKAQNDVGIRTDVLDGCPKDIGMLMMLRSMSPKVLAIDELGSRGELDAMHRASACGCRVVATVHGENLQDVERRFGLSADTWDKLFELFLILGKENGKCIIKEILERG